MRRCLFLAVAWFAFGEALPAQANTALLKPGVRVKLWSVEARYIGRDAWYASRSPDSLYVSLKRSFSEVPGRTDSVLSLRHVDKILVAEPTGMTWVEGARRGLAIGALVGGLGGAILALHDFKKDCEPICDPIWGRVINVTGYALIGGTLGGGAGGVVGLIVGGMSSTRWVAVSIKVP